MSLLRLLLPRYREDQRTSNSTLGNRSIPASKSLSCSLVFPAWTLSDVSLEALKMQMPLSVWGPPPSTCQGIQMLLNTQKQGYMPSWA